MGYIALNRRHEKIDISFTKEELSFIKSIDREKLVVMLEEDKPYKYGLTFCEYIYAVYSYFGSCKNYYFLHNYYDLFSFVGEYEDFFVSCDKHKKISINPLLKQELYKGLKDEYSVEEKIAYFYFKLCKILRTDSKYSFCRGLGDVSSYKKSINNLRFIVPGSEVTCFEFSEILGELIEREGQFVFYNYNGAENYGVGSHVDTKAIINKKYYVFEPYSGIEKYIGFKFIDFIMLKLNEGYEGIINDDNYVFDGRNMGLINFDDRHLDYLNKVYCDVCGDDSYDLDHIHFSDDDIALFCDIIEKLDISFSNKELIANLIGYLSSIPLDGNDYISFAMSFAQQFIESNNIDNVNVTGVCDSRNDNYCMSLILSVKDDNDEYIYLLFGKDNEFSIINSNEVRKKIDNLDLIVTSDYKHFIPGIDVEFQKKKNSEAVRNLLPLAVNKIYEMSEHDSDSKQLCLK